jgi:hypothetical protein
MATNALEQIKKLDDQRTKLLDQAKHEAMTRAQEALDDLNALGFAFVISEGNRQGRKSMRQKKDVPCPICKFKTSPAHDGRQHRAQGNKKQPFSSSELSSMGYSKV